MIQCKNCGKIVKFPSLSCNVSDRIEQYKLKNEKVPEILSDTYKNFHKVYICEDCRYPFDYKDFSMRNFFSWLMYSSDAGDSRSASIKAVTRYFGLDGKPIQNGL